MGCGSWEATLVGVGRSLDLETASYFRSRIAPVLGRTGDVILDLREVEVDSTGLGTLLSLQRRLELEDRRLLVVGTAPGFLDLLDRAGAGGALALFPDVEEATRFARGEAELAAV